MKLTTKGGPLTDSIALILMGAGLLAAVMLLIRGLVFFVMTLDFGDLWVLLSALALISPVISFLLGLAILIWGEL